jgi:hypothetical protein
MKTLKQTASLINQMTGIVLEFFKVWAIIICGGWMLIWVIMILIHLVQNAHN